MKRVLAIALSAAMLVSMMAGCSSNENSTETSTNTTEQTTEAPETTEEEAPAEEEASTEEETSSEIVAPESDVEMQYITVEDASANLESDDYTFIDVRKAEDYATSHIPGAISADMDAAKNGDFDAGVATMQEVLNSGVDNNLVLICYSGKTYAQATTNVLSALGYDMSKIGTPACAAMVCAVQGNPAWRVCLGLVLLGIGANLVARFGEYREGRWLAAGLASGGAGIALLLWFVFLPGAAYPGGNWLALVVGVVMAWMGRSLFQVAVTICLGVFLAELILI